MKNMEKRAIRESPLQNYVTILSCNDMIQKG